MRTGLTVLVAAMSVSQLARSETAAAAKPAKYAAPFQLRPAAAVNAVKFDDSLAISDGGTTNVTFLSGSYKVAEGWAPFVRVGAVGNWPKTTGSGFSVVNPALGVTYARPLNAEFRLAASLTATVPVGMGGGNTPEATSAAASKSGVFARSAMDNAMFAVNDFAVCPGIDLAYVAHDWTVQVEATVLQLTRVRGDKAQPDASKTNLTTGVFVGYFPVSALSVGGELKYQRWLSTPASVTKDAAFRDSLSFDVGARGHFKVAEGKWLRPGIAYTHGIDAPMTTQKYNIAQVDVLLNY
jgi:hypothetical protein